MEKYDVIVIGAGSAGLGSSGVAHTIGLKTLLIEKDKDHFGGDCTNYGCVPSKALIHIAQHFHDAKKANRFGLAVKGKADMKKVLTYIHEKQKIIRNEEDAQALRKHGQKVLIGEARFIDQDVIEVKGKQFSAKIFLLCTGSSPRMLEIPGMEEIRVYTNETIFFDCQQLPEHLVVVGGGPIGVELAQAFRRLGSEVYLVNRGGRLLGKEPVQVSKILQEQLEAEGIKIYNKCEVSKFLKGKAFVKGPREETQISCDAALIAVGRIVNTSDMGLERAGVALTEKGKIEVDTYLRSTNKKIYVLGDAAGTYMFSHGAEKMVRQLWRNLLIPLFKKKNKTSDLSWVTFTDPQVAHFGDTEADLDKKGIKYFRQDQDFQYEDRAIIQEYRYGRVSFWMTPGNNIGKRVLLSGSMIAPQAGELIQEIQLASHAKIPIQEITSRVYPYPVATRVNQKTLRGVMAGAYSDFKKKLARMSFHLFH